MSENNTKDLNELIEDYLKLRIHIEKLQTEMFQIRQHIYSHKKEFGPEENQEFKLEDGKVSLKNYISKYSSILREEFNELSNDEKREIYKKGLLKIRFRLNYMKYQKLKEEGKKTELDDYVYKRDESYPYYLNIKLNDKIKKQINDLSKKLEPLTAEKKLEIEELRGDKDETPDVYDAMINNLVEIEPEDEEDNYD